MARPKSLTSMSVAVLMKMRDDVVAALNEKANTLKKELRALGGDYAEVGRIAIYGKKRNSLAGRKVAAKYRDPKSKATWAGRGAQPVWLRDAVKAGKKVEDFLIVKPAAKAKGKRRKVRR
jgi:DNA-binding protein H-NS